MVASVEAEYRIENIKFKSDSILQIPNGMQHEIRSRECCNTRVLRLGLTKWL